MSLGRKYVFPTVMCLVFPMCILTSCSSVLCVLMDLGMCMFVNIMSLLMSVMSTPPFCVPCQCVWWCSEVFWRFKFLCEFCFLYCDDVWLRVV